MRPPTSPDLLALSSLTDGTGRAGVRGCRGAPGKDRDAESGGAVEAREGHGEEGGKGRGEGGDSAEEEDGASALCVLHWLRRNAKGRAVRG